MHIERKPALLVSLFTIVRAGVAVGGELEALPSSAPSECSPYSIAGISGNGRSLLTTDRCFPTDGSPPGSRGMLFDYSLDAVFPAITPLGPGYFTDLSGDGQSAVGSAIEQDQYGRMRSRGFVLRDLARVVDLGFLPNEIPGPLTSTVTTAISSDGQMVVGGATNACGIDVPFRWAESTGVRALPWLPSIDPNEEEPDSCQNEGWATDVSGDGSTVVGWSNGGPFFWTARQGMRPLVADDPEGPLALEATAISGDGRFVVGWGEFEVGRQPFVWSHRTGLIDLHDPMSGAGQGLLARDVSSDGSVVVGGDPILSFDAELVFEDRAFVWTRDRGTLDLREVLEALGIRTSGWASLATACKVSDDGSTIVGAGVRMFGNRFDVFRASLARPPHVGVGGCTVGSDGCFPVEVLASSGQAVREYEDLMPWSLEVITSLSRPSVNRAGDVAFSATLTSAMNPQPDPPASGAEGDGWSAVFASDGRGGVRVCPRHPFDAPDVEIAATSESDLLPANDGGFALLDDGSVVFRARISVNRPASSGGYDVREFEGIWRCDGRERRVSLSMPLTSDVPDESGELIAQIGSRFRIDGFGRPSVLASSTPSDQPLAEPDRTLIAASPAGRREVLLRSGELPPGVSDVTFGGAYSHSMSASGRLAIAGVLGPFGNHGIDDQSALWTTNAAGELELVLRSGAPAPDDVEGRTFADFASSFSTPSINDRGDVAIRLLLKGGASSTSSLWKRTSNGGLTKLVEAGAELPGLPPDRSLRYVTDPLIDARGDVLFLGLLDYGPDQHNHAYWLRTIEGDFIPLLRTGQPAPGLPDGIVLGESGFEESPLDPEIGHAALSDGGLSLLEFGLRGTGVDASNDRALFLVDRAGVATLVVRRGNTIQTAAHELRTIDEFRVWYGLRGDPMRRPINDRGDVVATLVFTDGTQAVARFAVPEPTSTTALAAASLALEIASRRRSRQRRQIVDRAAGTTGDR